MEIMPARTRWRSMREDWIPCHILYMHVMFILYVSYFALIAMVAL
jgi:hypothetical protein